MKNNRFRDLTLLIVLAISVLMLRPSSVSALEVEEFSPPTPNTSISYTVSTSSEGIMWFLKPAQKQVVRLQSDGSMTEYPMTTFGTNISQVQTGLLSVGPDGNIWYMSWEDGVHSYLNRINPDGSVNIFELKTLSNEEATPYLSHTLAVGPDGNFWTAMVRNFDEYYIAKYNTDGDVIEELEMPAGSPIYNIMAGSSNTMWYARPDKIGKVSAEGIVTEYQMPANHQAFGLEFAQDGNIWFTAIDDKSNQQDSKLVVGKITIDGEITLYPTEVNGIPPVWTLDLGPDGRLWFALTGKSKLAAVGMDGNIQYYDLAPLVLVSANGGPDGNIWVLSYSPDGGKVVRLFLDATTVATEDIYINPPSSPRAGNTTIGVVVGVLLVGVFSLIFRYIARDKTRERKSPR